jgi:hypothetical protein
VEGLPGPVRKAASDLLGKQPSAHPANGVVKSGNGSALPPASVAAEPALPSKPNVHNAD